MTRVGAADAPAPVADPEVELTVDVVVVGGGLGGVAAALAATDLGASVVIVEPELVLGGQLTSQLVACPDEHPLVESVGRTRTWARLRELVRARYGGAANPGGGWVSRLCATPADWLAGMEEMLRPALETGRLVVLLGQRPVALLGPEDQHAPLGGVVVEDAGGTRTHVRAQVTLDATETGDVLALAGGWVIGSEGRAAHDEEHALPAADAGAEQAVTWCAALRLTHLRPASAAGRSGRHQQAGPFAAAPRDGAPEHRFSLTLDGWDGTEQSYRFAAPGPGGRPPFWTYRRMLRGSGEELPGGGARVGDVICLNWASNDYDRTGLVAHEEATRKAARRLTADFVEWLRTDCPRDDGATGFPGLELAPDVALSGDGLAIAPYVRESRRIRREDPLTLDDLRPVPGSERARPQRDAIALVWYHADLHPRVGHPGSVYAPTAPAQVPVRCLLHPDRPDLLAAGKGLAATQVAAAATRVHPAEWGIGEAAGVLAALAVRKGRAPGQVVATPAGTLELQRALLARGAPVAWARDVADDDPDGPLLQLLLLHGAFGEARARSLDVRPDEPLDLANAAGRQAVVDAVAALGAARVGPDVLGSLPEAFTPRDLALALSTFLPGTDAYPGPPPCPRPGPDATTVPTTPQETTA